MKQKLHALIVEDSEDDVIFVVRELQRGGYDPVYLRVDTGEELEEALSRGGWDILIADYNLPQYSALDALEALKATGQDIPFLIVSGTIGEEAAVAVMKSGAHDYILKNSLSRLVPAVDRELREARVRHERQHARAEALRLAAIVESSSDAIIGQTLDATITTWNPAAHKLYGYTAEEAIGSPVKMLVPPDRAGEEEHIIERLRRGGMVNHFETVHVHKDGHRFDVSVTVSPIRDRRGDIIGASKISRDVTEQHRVETTLAALSKLGQSLSAASTPLDAARVIGNIADELFGWDAFSLDLYYADTNQIQTVLDVDTIQNEKRDMPPAYTGGQPSVVAKRIIEHGPELILRDVLTGMLPGSVPWGNIKKPSASLMFVPIRNQARVIGLMSVQSYKFKAYDQRTLGTLQTLGDYCGGALERMRAREELETSREQLRALAANLQSIREEERKLMSREIHDELGQALTGLKMDLAWMRQKMLAEEWDGIREGIVAKIKTMGGQIDETAVLVRKLCTELRPGVLDDLGLTAALEWQAREYQNRTNIVCEMQLDIGELQVDPERSTAFFRIFQEILTNVARHAQATRVNGVMKQIGSDLVMEVADNGRGIEPERVKGEKSLGLLGMRERALILGGRVDIQGAPGKGTKVRVTMPLPELKIETAKTETNHMPKERNVSGRRAKTHQTT